ncbi:uncharacterized protein PITG_21075 [Phytophthora infestans T30-4]|uniref:COMM domain-containing protein n=1 Tax=Phytophthora infestans (strain T30-4) TaxID=403677 RepID=D0P3I5_PHYIT|nr:uncharacterized protein PITG_21075 [Phytophthora infestans T30-4]EEY60028.1 conserved hypothetical protein [Phytophthora infestans T30-4]|eukprot:XP_002895140.1 conserved hypothetical protein [Phytophthora infestans T30-4]
MDTSTFIAAARDWHALLRDVGEAFVARYLELSMQLAVALYCQNDVAAEKVVRGVSNVEQRDFVALSEILRGLLQTATRQHMRFLLPGQTIIQSLPEAFESRFRQLLATYWNTLNEVAENATFTLPRLQQLHWKVANVAGQCILLRLQTSDGKTRTIHVPIKQFHQLRHSAASVLHEMSQVEVHPMLRLAHMEQSSRTESATTTRSGPTSNVP